jgi:hypothetical protein
MDCPKLKDLQQILREVGNVFNNILKYAGKREMQGG